MNLPDPEAARPPPPEPVAVGVDSAAAPDGGSAEPMELIAYRLPGTDHAPIVAAGASREWMRATVGQFAHRCLPLLIANQSGWLLLNPTPLRAVWSGGAGMGAVTVEYLDGTPELPIASSIFGYGILTWRVDYLFRTPPGYNLAVGGPANQPRDGIQALQGVVETDWSVVSFTMNWKFTRPDHPVVFEAGEPFCMLAPQRRRELESFRPRIVPIADRPELEAEWRAFEQGRKLMAGVRRLAFAKGGAEAVARVPWERHYMDGVTPAGAPAPEHQKKLLLREFRDADDPAVPDCG